MTPAEVSEGLGLDTLKNRQWSIHKSCAIKGEGLEEGLDWCVVLSLLLYVSPLTRYTETGWPPPFRASRRSLPLRRALISHSLSLRYTFPSALMQLLRIPPLMFSVHYTPRPPFASYPMNQLSFARRAAALAAMGRWKRVAIGC